MHDDRQQALIDTDRRRLVRAAARLLGPADAEDALQDAYVRALELKSEALDAAQAWMLTVVRHVAIDRLRRRDWMQRWLAEAHTGEPEAAQPSAETDAALAQEAALALSLLASRLTPEEGAVVLLHEVFEMSHADLARASATTEAGSRQQLRRALLRLRQPDQHAAGVRRSSKPDADEQVLLRVYLQSVRLRDPKALWAILGQPPVVARSGALAQASMVARKAVTGAAFQPQAGRSVTVQVDGQLGLVLSLDGVTLCVLPLGVQPEWEPQAAVA